MKILFFIESLGSGGKERRLVELIKGLSKDRNFDMELVLTKEVIHYTDILSTNINIHYIIRKGLKKDPRLFYKFFKITKNFKPDIIHVWGNLVAIYAIPTKFFFKIPMINSQITNAPINISNSYLEHRLTFPFSNMIIANTQAGLDAYSAPKKKSLVIYNGFDFNRIKGIEDKSILQQTFNLQTKYVIGMVASFNDKKDYTTFIEAANQTLEENHNITFLCIGSGDYRKFEQLVPEYNKNSILFLGKQDQVESIMNICDIGVLITNNEKHGEGISNAILEFSALGKPVIATLGGGNGEIIEKNVSGYLINPKSPDELVEKILYLISNKSTIDDFGKRSKDIVKEKFNISRMIDEFKSVYKAILK